MSKKAQQEAAPNQPIISEYDVYAGLYRAHPPRVEVGKDSFPVTDDAKVLAKVADGTEVIIGGRCEYKDAVDSQDCGRLPSVMTVKTCYPQ